MHDLKLVGCFFISAELGRGKAMLMLTSFEASKFANLLSKTHPCSKMTFLQPGLVCAPTTH